LKNLRVHILYPVAAGIVTGVLIFLAAARGPGFSYLKFGVVITACAFVSVLLWVLLSSLFAVLFRRDPEREFKACGIFFLLPVMAIFVLPLYFKLLSGFAGVAPAVLGNIYIPFRGFLHLDAAGYLLLTAAGAAWTAVFFIMAARFVAVFYRQADTFTEKGIKKIIFLFALIFYLLATTYVTFIYPPTGDEPHYLIAAESIARDFDVNLENNYKTPEEYKKFHPVEIEDYDRLHTIKGRDGEGAYSTRGMGLPFLLALFVKAGGRYPAQFFMNLAAAALCLAIFMLVTASGISRRNAAAAAMAAAVFMPLSAGASLILTEVPAALLTAYCLFVLAAGKTGGRNILFFVCIGIFPWLHVKMAVFSVVFLGAYYFRVFIKKGFNLRFEVVNILPVLLSAGLFVRFYYVVYGIIAPFGLKDLSTVVFSGDPSEQMNVFIFEPVHFITAAAAVIFDRDFGLLVYCPLYAAAFWGMAKAAAKKDISVFTPLFLCLPYIIIFLFWKDWTGSMTPARQMTPVIPVFALLGAYFFEHSSFIRTKLFKPLFVISLGISWMLAAFPLLRYGSSKDKIYAAMSKVVPAELFWVLPPFTENTAIGFSVALFYAVLMVLAYHRIKKTADF